MAKLAEFLFSGAASGVGVTTVADASGNGNALTVNFNTDDGAWGENASGRYLSVTEAANTSPAVARVPMNTGNLGANLEGATTFLILFKTINLQLGDYPHSPIIAIGAEGAAALMEVVVSDSGGGGTIGFIFSDGNCAFWDRASEIICFAVDTTQATAANRILVYRRNAEGTNEALTTPPFYTAPTQNAALSSINNGTTYLSVLNYADGNHNCQGGLKYLRFESGTLTQTQIFDAMDALAANDDADPMAAPTLAFVSAPAITSGTITSSGAQIQLTTNLAATVKVQDTAAGSSQPDASTFTGISATGTTTGHSVFSFAITGQSPSTTRRKWLQVSDGTTTLYASVDVTTTAVTNNILSINGGNPIRYNQATIDITWDQVPETLDPVSINGVAQTGHTGINSTTSRFGPLVWPNRMYGQTATLTTGSKSATTPQILPAVGYSYVTLSGYTEDPPATPDVATILNDPSAVAVDGDQFVFNSESGEISMDSQGRFSFGSGFDGNVAIAIVDSSDGAHSDFVTLYYGGAADLIPTIPAFGNLTNQEPGVEVVGSFVVADVDAGYDITFAAVGSMLVATSNAGPWLPSVTRQLGETVYRRMVTGALGQTVTGGVSSGGQSSTCTYTTRAANAPVITTHPSNQSVTSGAVATYTVAATNAGAYQWQKDTGGNGAYANISGANAATYARTTSDADIGTSNVRCVVTSPEGVAVNSNAATLTVIAAATRLVIPAGGVTARGASLAGATNVPINIRNVSGALIYSTTVTIAASGVTNIDNNQNGTVGTDRFVGFPSSVDGSEALIRLTVQAAV